MHALRTPTAPRLYSKCTKKFSYVKDLGLQTFHFVLLWGSARHRTMRRVVSRLALFFVFVLEVVSVTYVSSAVADNRSNIILILTDDQDITLQSMRAMPKTAKLFAKRGAQFLNAFVTSPLCCPSRASILTGQYAHNHNVSSNLDGDCYTQSWIRGPERQTVGKHLKDAGYRTGKSSMERH